MTFWQIFFRVFIKRPIRALDALYWHMTRRRVRARNRLLQASASLPFVYDVWMAAVEQIPSGDFVSNLVSAWKRRPKFSILLYASPGVSALQLRRSIKSIEAQAYGSWELVDCCEMDVETISGEYVVPLQAGDALSPAALYRFAEALQSARPTDLIYGDQDALKHNGRRQQPWFKPDWNAEMFLAIDYLSRAVAIRKDHARSAGLEPGGLTRVKLQEALLRATSGSANVVHVPHVTTHIDPKIPNTDRTCAVAQHVQSLGGACEPGLFDTVKVSWPLPSVLPKVSILIPTKDKIELLRPCIESVLTKTRYDAFEIIIIDNGSVRPETLAYLDEISRLENVRVLPFDEPYNFSAINNFAARKASGSFLCLLNNDTEATDSEWLTEMMRYAVRPQVGAVGAKLLYHDRTIQHAGVVVGIGEAAGHAHRFLPVDQPGYFGQPHVAHFVTAVTAACLVVAREKYEAVGGLDEEHLAVAFNDVDFCLKLQETGWKNVYVPHAVLIHHESKSRGSDFVPERVERYRSELRTLQNRWGTKTYSDPLHNPNLDRYSETYVVGI